MTLPSRVWVTCALLVLAVPATALGCDSAERQRLSEEQRKLAGRNAWTGVERTYGALLDTKCELSFEDHFLGAEAARLLGKVLEQHDRLTLALASAPTEVDPDRPDRDPTALRSSIDAIEAAYRRVEVRGDPRRRPVLTRAEMPFATDQRKAIEWAQTVVAETGSFTGMLPFGAYVVGETEFSLEAGPDVVVVEVGKVKKSAPAPVAATGGSDPAPASGGTEQQAFVRYASLVALVGPGVLTSPESAAESSLADGTPQFSPADVFGSGFGVQVGGELGLTYAEPALGLAATLGYDGAFGTDTMNAVNVCLQGVMRPGNLRVAVGPMYQVVFGAGTGVAESFHLAQQQTVNADIPYAGAAWGGGARASVGYGVLDLEPLQGFVELGGGWQTDLIRNYFQAGLRVGIVPKVPRFEG